MVVHPGFLAALFAGALVVFAGKAFYDEYYNEYKRYEQFQSNHYDREFNRFHRSNNDFDFDDDREEEEARFNEGRSEQSDIRKRKPFSSLSNSYDNIERSDHEQSQYELDELEASIAERKRRLMAEQAFLEQEEENLRNRKNALMNNSFNDVTPSHQPNGTDSSSSSSSSNNSDEEDDEHSLRNHMAVFDPFADQFQDAQDHGVHSLSNSDSTERMVVAENNDRHSEQQQVNLENSTELRFPSPHSNTPTTSSASSVANEERPIVGISDSEESWDAVSELEDWNQSSAYSSDNELHSHRSIASDSDDDRLRF